MYIDQSRLGPPLDLIVEICQQMSILTNQLLVVH
jgi:hypothetical protein